MNKLAILGLSLIMAEGTLFLCGCGCGDGKEKSEELSGGENIQASSTPGTDAEIPMKEITVGSKTYNVADISDESHIYKRDVDRSRCLVVISKREFRLYVYECGQDTVLAASFPVCYAKNPGPKTREGDMSTPENSDLSNPFTISEIKSASDWCHDFGDGRGMIKAYGDWFVRLQLTGDLASNRSIGIHGSTNNEASVPGRDSEGCIRLRDADIIQFHDLYAQVGQKVLIKGVGEHKLPFEVKAEKALGGQYAAPKSGNSQNTQESSPESVSESEYEDDCYSDEGIDNENNTSEEGEVG